MNTWTVDPASPTGQTPGTSVLTARLVLQVVADHQGPAGVSRVLERAGLQDRRKHLESLTGRISYSTKLRLFDAAAAELCNPRIGLLFGPAAVHSPGIAPLRALMRAMGSPEAVLRNASRISTRLDTASVFRAEKIDRGVATMAWKVLPPHSPNRIDCDYHIGMLAQTPVFFGLPIAQVEHRACQVDGDPECLYQISWKDKSCHRLRRRFLRFKRSETGAGGPRTTEDRLQALQGATADLISGEGLEQVLDRIAARADTAVHAPGHLLAVCLPGGTRHLRFRGTGTVLVDALGSGVSIDQDAPDLAGLPVLSVPVASATHSYGVLAAVAHHGQTFFPEDTDTLAAYARHAAVSLDLATLLAETREQGETAQLLLGVAQSLNKRSTVEEVAQSIADAVPALSGANRSAIALWDGKAGRVRIAGMKGWEGPFAEKLACYVTTAKESPELTTLLTHGAPLLVDRNGSDWARQTLDDFQVHAFASIPIMTESQLVGIVLAHWTDTTAPKSIEGALRERLTGLADMAAVAMDNTRLLEEARRQAFHDPLTGLPNRALLEDRLESALSRASLGEYRVGLLFCDINRFKRINDSLGHGIGDQVLRQVADRLSSAIREGDTVARYSGDEFVILLPGIAAPTDESARSEIADIADRIRTSLDGPYEVNDNKMFVDVAIGTALSESAACGSASTPAKPIPGLPTAAARDLIENADREMYCAKARARGQKPPQARSPDRLRFETELRGAAGRGELRVHFQPQIDLTTNQIVAAEALVRWHHPQLGLLTPAAFIPVAEESDLISEIGAYVLFEACRIGSVCSADGRPIEMAVNVSATQFDSPGFAAFVKQTLHETGFPATALTLEITETQVSSETTDGANLHALEALGVGFSIDDFGTGYSSLTQLHRLPVTEIKIDRSFTRDLVQDKSSAVVAGILGLGQGLGLRVVAEGIETSDQLETLKTMGCERAQGYLLGKPMDAMEFRNLLTKQDSRAAVRS